MSLDIKIELSTKHLRKLKSLWGAKVLLIFGMWILAPITDNFPINNVYEFSYMAIITFMFIFVNLAGESRYQ